MTSRTPTEWLKTLDTLNHKDFIEKIIYECIPDLDKVTDELRKILFQELMTNEDRPICIKVGLDVYGEVKK